MDNVTQKRIAPGIRLTCVNTFKFKTGCISVTLMTPLRKETAAFNAVLPYVLCRGTVRHPDMMSISKALEDLYGSRIEPVIRKKGEIQCIGFFADFPDDAFIPGGGKILEKVIALMGEMLLAPATSGGRLRRDYVEGERDNLINDIKAEINDKRTYSVHRLVELMCKGEHYGVSKLGTVRQAEKISVATLTKHYKELISTSDVEIIYCGSAAPDTVERAVRDAFSSMPRADVFDIPATEVVERPRSGKTRVFEEHMDVTQGKLVLGYRLGNASYNQDYAALLVFNAVFGGSVTSKLFSNVREKLSLCYYASSAVDKLKGIMVVSSGIEFSNYDKVLKEIETQLENVKNGEISDFELESARLSVRTSLSASMDSPIGVEAVYLDRVISGMMVSPEELAALVCDVTVPDIVRVAYGIRLDSTYFLTGEEKNG